MSGIAAIYYRDGRRAQRDEIERVARALKMHGPERLFVRVEGPVAFAYAHFTDTLEARGNYQPETGGGGRFTMVFDGRLDNREDLGRDLGIKPDDVRFLSDCQLAMRCWERWGREAATRWVGEFALICWDKQDAALTAVRDQFGWRTLHLHETPDRIVFASAPKGLHALEDIPREVDEQKVADALSQLYHDGERTFFKGIRRLRQGSMMTVAAERLNVTQYYDFRENIPTVRYKTDEEYVEAANALLETATKACLRSPGPVGAFMSGGLDSSTMAIYAARELERKGQRLHTFTSVPEPGWDQRIIKRAYGDETPYVQAIAEKYPAIELNLVTTEGMGLYHKQEELLHALDMPVRNALNLHWTHGILQKAKERGITVMLQGVQGNASLTYAGDGIFTYLLKQGAIPQLYKELSLLGRTPIDFVRKSISRVVLPLGPTWLWDLKEQARGRHRSAERWRRFSMVDPSFAHEMHIPERARDLGFDYAGKPKADAREAWVNIVTRTCDLGDIVRGLTALYGVDIRDPFADRRLMEWSFGVPEDQFYRNGVSRWLIKRMMDGVLPESVLHKKVPFGMQTPDWHRRMSRDLSRMRTDLAEMAKDPDLARMIDLPRVKKLLDDWPDKTPIDMNDDLWFMLPTNVPLTMQVARFVQRVKGVNIQQ